MCNIVYQTIHNKQFKNKLFISKNTIMETKKSTSIYFSDESIAFLRLKFKNVSAGINEAIGIIKEADALGISAKEIIEQIKILQQIRKISLKELRGVFKENEWKFLADVLKDKIITSEFRCLQSGLIAEIEESEHFYGKASKMKIDLKEITEKIEILTGAEIDAIYFRVEQFWGDKNRNIDDWCRW